MPESASVPAASCPNCGQPAPGKFCAACGQAQGPLHVTVREIAHEAIDELLQLDSKLVRTLKPLLTRPGWLTCEYLAGRRERYVRPFRLYLLAEVALFLVLALIAAWSGSAIDPGVQARQSTATALANGVEAGGEPASKRPTLEAVLEKLPQRFHGRIRAHLERFVAGGKTAIDQRIGRAYLEYGPKAQLVVLPVFALLLLLLFRRQQRYYGAHFVFALHYHAAYVLGSMVTTLVDLAVPRPLAFMLGIAFMISVWSYLFIALRRVYGVGRFGTLVREIALLASYTVVQIAVTISMVLVAIVTA